MKRTISILDTTLRDGEQAPGCQLNTAEKIQVARALEDLGVDIIEAGFPISSPGDLQSVIEVSKAVTDPIICVLARALQKDIDASVEALRYARRKRIHVFLSSSDIHITHQFRTTREKILEQVTESVRYAKKHFEDVQFCAMDAGRSDNAFLATFVQAAIGAGATVINIADTTGYCLPDEFGGKIRYLFDHIHGIENVTVSVHCHNDLGLATANTIAAIQNGAQQLDVTINGVGERAGNTALEEAIMVLRTRTDLGVQTNVKTQKIAAVSKLVSDLMQMPIQANKAIVGANAFAHSSGIHQNGLLKHRSTYEIINPEDVGVKPSTLPLNARSGRSALRHHLKRLGYTVDKETLDHIYEKFLIFADQKKHVTDEDLLSLMNSSK